MNNRTIVKDPRVTQYRPVSICDISCRGHAEYLKFTTQTCANSILNTVVCPLIEIKIPQWRVIKGHGRDSTQDVQRIAFSKNGAIQSLSPRMMSLVIGSTWWKIGVGVAVDADEEALNAAEKGVVGTRLDIGQAARIRATVECSGKWV